MQFHFCRKFLTMALARPAPARPEWQMVAIGGLFGLIALGNLGTTIHALWRKLFRATTAVSLRGRGLASLPVAGPGVRSRRTPTIA